jgi:hypothetical protein
MLDLDPKNLMREIRASDKFLEPFIKKGVEINRVMSSNHYRNGGADSGRRPKGKATPENYPFCYKAFVKPQILFGIPNATITPLASTAHKPLANGMEIAVNNWSKETDWKSTLDMVLDDCFAFNFGVVKSGVAATGHYNTGGQTAVEGDFEQRPNFPFAVRIAPRDFIIDTRADKLTKCRLMGQKFERDIEDVKADLQPEGLYIPEAVAELSPKEKDRDGDMRAHPSSEDRGPDRKAIVLYELYLPEYHQIITLAETNATDGVVVIRNEPCHGPDEGIYVIFGLESATDEILPISPLVALWDEIEATNEHARNAAKSAETHKKIIGYKPSAKDDAQRIKDARNGGIIPINDPDGVKDFEIGGVSKEQVAYTELERNRTDRNLGFTDAQRGMATGAKTATEAGIADASSDLRVDGMRDRIADAVRKVYRNICWYFYNDDTIEPMRIVHTDPMTGQTRDATFFPGPSEGAYVNNIYIEAPPSTDFTDFSLTIDVRTMQKQNDALVQKRAQDMMALVTTAAPMMVQFPYINWKQLMGDVGKAFNDPLFGERILNVDMLAMQGAIMADQAAAANDPNAQQSPAGGGPSRSPSSPTGLRSNASAGTSTSARS